MLAKHRARVEAGEIAYVDAGDPESPAVVLLHGFPTSSFLWRDLVPFLAPWFRVIAPDLLGYGDSDKPTDQALDIRAQASCVRDLLVRLGVTGAGVVGHALGGGVAQLLALDGPRVEAMVLLDSIAFDSWPSEQTRELQSLGPDQETEAVALAVLGAAFELGMGRRARPAGDAMAEYSRPWRGDDGARAFFRAARAVDGVGLAGRDGDLAGLDLPVLLVWGEDDAFVPVAVADRLADAIPTSTLALLPGCSHFVTEDAPESVGPLVFEYLRARYLKRPHGHAEAGPVPVVLGRRPTPEEELEA